MRQLILASLFIVLFVTFHFLSAKIGGGLSNFSPFVAFFFCGAAFFHRSKLLLPAVLVSWVIAAPITSIYNGYTPTLAGVMVPLFTFALIALIGLGLQKAAPWKLLLASVGSGVLFHIITNLWCFFTDPLYTKDFTGLAQALWTLPPHPGALQPTAFFLRNTCTSTLLFTALFIAAAYLPYLRPLKQGTVATQQVHN